MLKILLTYGGWITITAVISPILVYLDRFFIGSILTMKDLTYYSAPLEAVLRLRILPLAIMTTLFPEFSIGLGSTNHQRLLFLFEKSFKLILISTGIFSSCAKIAWKSENIAAKIEANTTLARIIFNFFMCITVWLIY